MKLKPWIPTILLAVLAAALVVVMSQVERLALEEDRSAQLQAQLQAERDRRAELEGQLNEQTQELETAQGEFAALQRQQERLEADRADFDDLLTRWRALQQAEEVRRSQSDGARLWECTIAPNYDRRCLTYLQGGNKVTSAVSGFLGGIFGKLMGNSINNMTQEDVGVILTMISELNDEINAAIQSGERAVARLEAGDAIMENCYDPEASGEGLRAQVEFLEQMGRAQEADDTQGLRDIAWAAAVLEHYLPVYDVFLSESTENSAYLDHARQCLTKLRDALTKQGKSEGELLTKEEQDELCRKAVFWHQRIGTTIQNSQIWLETSTMTTSLVSQGNKVTTTWRDPNKTMIAAADHKGGQTAYYGFDAGGEPFCVLRGELVVLFDWRTGNGTALYTTCSPEDTAGLYRFAAFLRDEKNGFTKTQYEQNQRVY